MSSMSSMLGQLPVASYQFPENAGKIRQIRQIRQFQIGIF